MKAVKNILAASTPQLFLLLLWLDSLQQPECQSQGTFVPWRFFSFFCMPPSHPETGCVFPFIYKGKSYHRCTSADQHEGKSWCATTPDYHADLKWRLCNQTDCVFPFVFRGKSYNSCTRAGRTDRRRWCSLTANADAGKDWLFC
uniref:Fibronectin type-II domain-containing protein n=1 Tax=Salvator merianae TaxID=96440 RepID=A0A8D0E4Z4_SALMN